MNSRLLKIMARVASLQLSPAACPGADAARAPRETGASGVTVCYGGPMYPLTDFT